MGTVAVIDHPLVQHKLTLMRRKDTSTNDFRRLLNEISTLMAYDVLRDTPDARDHHRHTAGDHHRERDRR